MELGIVSLVKWKKQAEMLLLNFKEQDELLKSYNDSGVEYKELERSKKSLIREMEQKIQALKKLDNGTC